MNDFIKEIRAFNKERDWDQFHSPKNLAMALTVEVGEIVQQFQWLTQEESKNLSSKKLKEIKEEIGDVVIYVTNLADKLGIDPLKAAKEKLEKNKSKYPVEMVKGKSLKYSEYE